MNSNTPIHKIKTEFSLAQSTSIGGSKIFLDYLEKIKLRQVLQTVSGGKARNALFPVHHMLLYLIIGWVLGCERLFHFRRWQKDSLLQRFLGGRCPHYSLLYKELARLATTNPHVRMELRRINLEMIRPTLPSTLILDLDSTVETVYGNQTKAAKGVNAHKPGRKSYHPLLAFEGQSRICLNAVLRGGNVHSSTEASAFLEETFGLLGQHAVQYARFDKGFGGEDFYSLWEERQIGYVGKIKWTKRLAAEAAACPYWTRYVDEDWIIEGITLWYPATSWKKSRRVAVIRKAKVIQDDQACLLLDTDWEYEAIVTNLDWESIDLWRFYNQRCCMENYIKEAKRGFSIDKIATGSFEANEIDLLLKLLAYNLFERFKRDCCEPIHFGYTVARFRLEFFQCAATLVSHSRTTILKLMKEFVNRHAWKRMEFRIAQLE